MNIGHQTNFCVHVGVWTLVGGVKGHEARIIVLAPQHDDCWFLPRNTIWDLSATHDHAKFKLESRPDSKTEIIYTAASAPDWGPGSAGEVRHL